MTSSNPNDGKETNKGDGPVNGDGAAPAKAGRTKAGPPKGQDMEREARLTEQIDANLQRIYRETLNEPIPDRFLDLIAELRNKLDRDGH
jgi:hypothetical protein